MKKFLLDYITCRIGSHPHRTADKNVIKPHQTVDQNAKGKKAVSWSRENILLETFHRSNVAVYQAKDEISSTYNIYLLVAGIIAAGLPVVQELIYRPETNQEFKYFLVVLSGTVLVFSGLLSVGILGRFLQLANERYENTCIMNKTQNFYIGKLAATENSDMQEIERIIHAQQGNDQGKSIPPVIRFTVFVLGSASFGGALAIFFQATLSPLALIFIPGAIFIILFALFWWYYQHKVKI